MSRSTRVFWAIVTALLVAAVVFAVGAERRRDSARPAASAAESP
jgi:cytochrome c-type biogenesis protein CcmH/NrfF